MGTTVVVELYTVDVPPENLKEDTCVFVDTFIRCNLQSHAMGGIEDLNRLLTRPWPSSPVVVDGRSPLLVVMPFFGLDGSHLKGPYGRVLLCAVSLDANNGLFPIAFAVVEGASTSASQTSTRREIQEYASVQAKAKSQLKAKRTKSYIRENQASKAPPNPTTQESMTERSDVGGVANVFQAS
ncbi:abscisic acid receptor PYL4-like [Senna tora]|uniref:Abscisic acid receptor PYL4-like n=1 Tax=Senna tora TaxID=362788 RepID=A0A834WBB0_9FABA|nr:abscisic acid receptor PYL4-like [Senna tora]